MPQIEALSRHCETCDLRIVDTYVDVGSGLHVRPGLRALLRDGRRGAFDVVVVMNVTRFGRRAKIAADALSELDGSGVRVMSVDGLLDTTTASGRTMAAVLIAMETPVSEAADEVRRRFHASTEKSEARTPGRRR